MYGVILDEPPAEIPKIKPIPKPCLAIGTFWRGTQPSIPIHTVRNSSIQGSLKGLPAEHIEDSNKMNITQLARSDKLARTFRVRAAPILGTELHDPVIFASCFDHLPTLPDVVAGRLFDVDILARLASPDRS